MARGLTQFFISIVFFFIFLIVTIAGHQNASFAQFLHPFKYKKRFKWNVCCNYLSTQNQSGDQSGFTVKNALIVSKLSRYEYEQHRHQRLNANALEQAMRDRGTDYDGLRHHHHIHKGFEKKVADSFRHFGVNVKILNRWGGGGGGGSGGGLICHGILIVYGIFCRLSFTTEHTKWADVVVPIGGDGTFLLAAGRGSPIGSLKKPIFGFNSDPIRSEGRLMLPKQYSYDPKKAVHKLITVSGAWGGWALWCDVMKMMNEQFFVGRFWMASSIPHSDYNVWTKWQFAGIEWHVGERTDPHGSEWISNRTVERWG